jgi:hypothetical protein
LTISLESHTAGEAVDFLIKLALKAILASIKTHPDSAFSRFMLKQHGCRPDEPRAASGERTGFPIVAAVAWRKVLKAGRPMCWQSIYQRSFGFSPFWA